MNISRETILEHFGGTLLETEVINTLPSGRRIPIESIRHIDPALVFRHLRLPEARLDWDKYGRPCIKLVQDILSVMLPTITDIRVYTLIYEHINCDLFEFPINRLRECAEACDTVWREFPDQVVQSESNDNEIAIYLLGPACLVVEELQSCSDEISRAHYLLKGLMAIDSWADRHGSDSVANCVNDAVEQLAAQRLANE